MNWRSFPLPVAGRDKDKTPALKNFHSAEVPQFELRSVGSIFPPILWVQTKHGLFHTRSSFAGGLMEGQRLQSTITFPGGPCGFACRRSTSRGAQPAAGSAAAVGTDHSPRVPGHAARDSACPSACPGGDSRMLGPSWSGAEPPSLPRPSPNPRIKSEN